MRIRGTVLLLVCLGAWIHTAASFKGPAGEFDVSSAYPEDQDGSGDDLEISGSGSGNEGTNVPEVTMTTSSTTTAPVTSETARVAVTTEQGGVPVAVGGETTSTTTSEAPPTSTPVTTEAATDSKATANTDEPANPAVAYGSNATETSATTTTTTTTSTEMPTSTTSTEMPTATSTEMSTTTTGTATPDQFNSTGGLWELPEDPLRATTSANPVASEESATPPHVMSSSTPESTESSPVETTPSLLTTQSSPTTAARPVWVDAGAEFAAKPSTSAPVPAEEEEEEEEEEERTTSLLPASTPTFETDLVDGDQEEMASGDDAVEPSSATPQTTESAKPADPLIPVNEEVIVKSRSGDSMANPGTVLRDSDLIFEESDDFGKVGEAHSENQSLLERKEVLGGVIAGGVVGLAFAVMLVSLMVYRMKKKDEGSYSLDEHKHPNCSYQKARRQEEFLA